MCGSNPTPSSQIFLRRKRKTMGCQGEIYNIYGITIPAKIHQKSKKSNEGWDTPVIYKIDPDGLGKLVSHDEGVDEYVDYHAGVNGDLMVEGNPLVVRVLGHDHDMGSRHFKQEALVGYVVANESYVNGATALPDLTKIKALAPRLIAELKEKYGLTVAKDELKLFLLFDYLNGG